MPNEHSHILLNARKKRAKKKSNDNFFFFLLSSKLKQKKSLERNQKRDKTRVSMNNKDSKTLISHYLPVNLNSGA